MIKFGWENLINSVETSTTPAPGGFDSYLLKYPENVAKQHINYYSNDFLGLKSTVNYNLESEEKCNLLNKAKNLLGQIFKSNVDLFFDEKTVHLNILNHLVSPNDVIVVDQFVNTNIELASIALRKRDIKLFKISHHDIGELESILKKVDSSAKVWYLAQGTYPVPGDQLPVSEIKTLLRKYPQFFIYIDDSYSLGWTGEFGSGLIKRLLGKQVVITASLDKGFGAEGGIVVISENLNPSADSQMLSLRKKNIVQNIVNTAETFLSSNIEELQNLLQENIRLFHSKAQRNNLPVISNPELPMIFIAAGKPVNCGNICSTVLKEGMFISSACFPLLPVNCSGIKINITLKHTQTDIKNLIDALTEAYRQNSIKQKIETHICGCIKTEKVTKP